MSDSPRKRLRMGKKGRWVLQAVRDALKEDRDTLREICRRYGVTSPRNVKAKGGRKR